jgi:hypothetical protein
MEWQIIVLVLQILMLGVGWFLFQQARGELTSHAAQIPVLGEVRALQRNIKQLLDELTQTSDRAAGQLEQRCIEARELLSALDQCLDHLAVAQEQSPPTLVSRGIPPQPAYAVPSLQHVQHDRSGPEYATIAGSETRAPIFSAVTEETSLPRQTVYSLADRGSNPAEIAHTIGMSEGEVETLLALRPRRER